MGEKNLIVIPTYNEAENIEPLLKQIFQFAPNTAVLFVDDNSQDETQKKISEHMEQRPAQIHILKRSGKLGLGSAYLAGFRWGLERGYETFVQMDADLSHQPKYLTKMLRLLELHDVVIASRYLPGGRTENWNFFRRLISQAGSIYARAVLKLEISDFTGGFNGWRRAVLEKLDFDSLLSQGYVFQIEMKYRAVHAGFHFCEFPIVFVDRVFGQSKMSMQIAMEAAYRVLLLRKQGRQRLLS